MRGPASAILPGANASDSRSRKFGRSMSPLTWSGCKVRPQRRAPSRSWPRSGCCLTGSWWARSCRPIRLRWTPRFSENLLFDFRTSTLSIDRTAFLGKAAGGAAILRRSPLGAQAAVIEFLLQPPHQPQFEIALWTRRLARRNCPVRPSRQTLWVGRTRLGPNQRTFPVKAAVLLHEPAPQAIADIVVERPKELARPGTEAIEVAPASLDWTLHGLPARSSGQLVISDRRIVEAIHVGVRKAVLGATVVVSTTDPSRERLAHDWFYRHDSCTTGQERLYPPSAQVGPTRH